MGHKVGANIFPEANICMAKCNMSTLLASYNSFDKMVKVQYKLGQKALDILILYNFQEIPRHNMFFPMDNNNIRFQVHVFLQFQSDILNNLYKHVQLGDNIIHILAHIQYKFFKLEHKCYIMLLFLVGLFIIRYCIRVSQFILTNLKMSQLFPFKWYLTILVQIYH